MIRKLSFAMVPLLLPALLGACSMAPDYQRPITALPATFKEQPGWVTAAPTDGVAKGEWWLLFDDPVLDALERQVAVSNQSLAASAAAYRQATAAVRESRAGLFPSLSASGKAGRSESIDGASSGVGLGGSGLAQRGTTYSLALEATWQPDLWGQLGNAVSQGRANAEASKADLANATLAAQGELASSYLQLRGIDAQKALLDCTVTAYERALAITRNRLREGVVMRSDVLQAETQLRDAQAQAADLVRQRATYEHAIALLVGDNPSSFAIAPESWREGVPAVPATLPGALVQRRPDVAAAERRVAAANAAIGIQRAGFFPGISLTGSASTAGSSLDALFDAPTSLWSLGAGVAQTVFDFGATSARVEQARAAYDQAVASYRQTVLTAFQQTEDGLVGVRVLAEVAQDRAAAAKSASEAEAIAMRRYLEGETDYLAVVTAQATALGAAQARVQAVTNRQVAAVSLIQAIGGTW